MLDSHRSIVRGAGSIILASVLFVSGATTPAWAEDASAGRCPPRRVGHR